MPPDAVEAVEEIEGHWVGKEKSRYDFVLKLLEKKSTSRGYFVYRMTDKQGNFYIAFDGRSDWNLPHTKKGTHPETNGPSQPDGYTGDHKLQTGDCFTCKATVNRHDKANFKFGGPDSEYKQTVLNRIKLKEFIGRTDGYESYNE